MLIHCTINQSHNDTQDLRCMYIEHRNAKMIPVYMFTCTCTHTHTQKENLCLNQGCGKVSCKYVILVNKIIIMYPVIYYYTGRGGCLPFGSRPTKRTMYETYDWF